MENKMPIAEEEIRDVLKESVLFRDIGETELADIMHDLDGRVHHLTQEETYSMPGDIMNRIGIVIQGELLISRIRESGEENLIQKLSRGYTAGAEIVFSTTRINPYLMYASADTIIWTFSADSLLKESCLTRETRQKLLLNMTRFLANENVRKQFKIDVLSKNSLRERILAYLTTRSAKLGKSEFTIPFNREEMANYLCVNRSALSHELSLMREEGLIDFRKNYFRINRVDKNHDTV